MTFIFANARPALPFFFDGGAERTTFTLASSLARSGTRVVQISTLPRGSLDLAETAATSLGTAYVKQSEFRDGSITFETKTDHLAVSEGLLRIIAIDPSEFETVCREIVSGSKPGLLVTWLDESDLIIRLGDEFNIPTVLRVVGPLDDLRGYPPLGTKTVVLANSPLTAHICSAHYRRQVDFLLEVVDHSEFVVEPRQPRFVTYINPRKEKGVHLFCKVAALLPEIPFLVVHGWSRTDFQRDELWAIDFLDSLPNVTLTSPVADMRHVYGVTSLLLLPSRWPESWARVVGEAQASGIPVIASNRGCSPQNVGQGGIILDYDDPRMWASTVKLLYECETLMSSLGEKAKLNVGKFHPRVLLKDYEEFFSAVSEGRQAQRQLLTDEAEIFRGRKDGQGGITLEPERIPMHMNFDLLDPTYP